MSISDILGYIRSLDSVTNRNTTTSDSPASFSLPRSNPSAFRSIASSGVSPCSFRSPERHSDKIIVKSPATPKTAVISGVASRYISPCAYHSPGFVDKNTKPDGIPNKKLKNFKQSLNNKRHNSLVFGSATKDVKRIRQEKITPDENGKLLVKSASSNGFRKWGMHDPKPDGSARLFPIKGPNILPLEGHQLNQLIASYGSSKVSPTFKDHVIKNTEKVSRKLFLSTSGSDDDVKSS